MRAEPATLTPLREAQDERVQGALDEMIKEVAW
jgi:hypothetical protein